MLSKATYLMQDHLRYSYALIADVHVPRVFLVRGRLPFGPGLVAVSRWFNGCTAAAVYAHPYFVERQSDAAQPSPSLHLTEEVQSVCKVVSGLRYMRDDHAKLDNTMVFMTDSSVVVRGRMLRFADAGSARVRRRPHATGEDKATTTSSTTAAAAAATMARVRRSMTTMPHAVPGMRNSNTTTTTAAESASAMGAAAAVRSSDTFGFVKRGSAAPAVRSRFPSTEQSCQDAEACHAFFRVVQQQRNEQTLRATNASSSSSSSSSSADEEGYEFVETEGAYTVLYNPIEVNETTFGDVLDKLYYEGRTVACIVVPSRQTWRQLQVWADAFPDAEIVTSHCIPTTATTSTATSTPHDDKDDDGSHTRHEHAATAATAAQRGGIRELGNGVVGMHFLDMSEDDSGDTTTTTQQQQDTCTSSGSKATRHGRDDDDNDDPADVLWDASSREAMATLHTPHAGLRAADAARMRVLCNSSSSTSAVVAQPRVQLTPTLTLHHIAGDAVTDEYVLHDAVSGVLACTDVFHGTYGDYDPVNSWMCRVWFKFMKKGNHKRIDCVPRYKWLQVTRQQRTLPQLRDCVDALTRTCAMRYLVAAHGTPPHSDNAANALRRQWGMATLPMAQLPPWSPAS